MIIICSFSVAFLYLTTKGYIYKPDGLPMSSDASTYAYDVFNSIVDEAEGYHKGQYQKQLKRSQNKISNSHISPYISRWSDIIVSLSFCIKLL